MIGAIRVVAAVAVVSGVAGASFASVINLSQSRSLEARAAFTFPVGASTPAVGPWNESVSVQTPGFSSGGTATQTSLVSDARFTAVANVSANDDVQTTSGGAGAAFFARFEVTQATPYSLVGSWFAGFNFGETVNSAAGMSFRRTSPDAAVFYEGVLFGDFGTGQFVNSGSVNLAGVLTPGVYEIAANVDITVIRNPGVFSSTGDFNFDLIVPSPGAASMLLIGGVGVLGRRRRV